jgi:hypothetical protein
MSEFVENTSLDKYIEWLKIRIQVDETPEVYIRFVMEEYAKDFHEQQIKEKNSQ